MDEKPQYRIRGLDCAEEVAALRKTVGRLPGVASLDFDILNAKMTVTLAPNAASEDEVMTAVKAAGLEALPWRDTPTGGAADTEQSFWQRRRHLLLCVLGGLLLAAGFISHALIHHSLIDALAGGQSGQPHSFPLASLLLYIACVLTAGWYIIPKAIMSARMLRADMNLLMMIAVAGALIIGQWFEAATVTFLFAVSLLLESWSVGRARRAISALMNLSPTTARTICQHHGDIEEKPAENVAVGAIVVVRPGEKIPLDGVITKGSTSINQAPITGESALVTKAIEDKVYAGTINNDGAFEFKVTKAANDTTLARIIRMVEESQSRRAPSEQWVEKFARYYTPVMILLAICIAATPPLVAGASWSIWVYRALVLLVIACPCALVISTPVSIVAGLTTAARAGVLIKGGVYLEAPAHLSAVAMDKTGTLTHGRPTVQEVVPFDEHTRQELLAIAASLEYHSEHPLARAILAKAQDEGVNFKPAEDFRITKGKGAEASMAGRPFWIGSHRFMHAKIRESSAVHDRAEKLEANGHTVVALGNDDHVCGLISIADGIRPEAVSAVQALKELGIKQVIMLTGDNEGTARAVRMATGVNDYQAELLPEDKVRAVAAMVKEFGRVAMVGDGVNDAPAMATATFGVAMGAVGTDAAIETADIALMADDLSRLPWLIRHSQRTMEIIKQNIWFALGVKLLFMGLAVLGSATLWMAIAADMGTSLLVIFNGLRLLQRKD